MFHHIIALIDLYHNQHLHGRQHKADGRESDVLSPGTPTLQTAVQEYDAICDIMKIVVVSRETDDRQMNTRGSNYRRTNSSSSSSYL